MRLAIYTAVLLLLLTGTEAQQKAVPPECKKFTRVHGSFPKGTL
jgi:hypothetical protein